MDRIHDASKIFQEVSDARMAEFVLLATVKKSTQTETLNDENDEQQDAGLVEATYLLETICVCIQTSPLS